MRQRAYTLPILTSLTAALAVLLTVASPARSQTVEDAFAQANDSYEARDYATAIAGYESIRAQGLESAPLYLNLGNAYFKEGDLGRAILNYLRARRLDPGDDDINANLAFARSFTRVQMEGVQLNPIRDLLDDIVSPYRLDFFAWLSALLFVGFWILMSIRYGMGLTGIVSPALLWLVGIVLLTGCFLTTYKYRAEYLTPHAVLLCEECTVRTGPSEDLEIELQAAPGLTVEILDSSGDWVNVLFENKRRGWIRKDLVAEI